MPQSPTAGIDSVAVSTARVVAGRYTLVRPIGRGRSGVVYVARAKGDHRPRALKLVATRPRLSAAEVAHFQQALTAMVRIDHPQVLVLEDAGWDAARADLYLAMPLLHGETLRDLIRRGETDLAIDAIEAALEPLAAAHAKGYVHGDLSPSNIFHERPRTGEPRTHLLDFGLSRVLRPLLADGSTLGAAACMAPEQHRGEQESPRTDVWAIGAILYEIVCGAPAFTGASPAEVARAVCDRPHRPASELTSDEAMAQIAQLCLQKDPSRRPPDARTLTRLIKTMRTGSALMRNSGERAVLDTVIDQSGAAPPPPPDELEAALTRNPRDPRVHRALLAYYRAEGIRDGAWLATVALDVLGHASRDEARMHHHYRRPSPGTPDRGIDAGGWAALLHPDQDPRIDAVWSEVADAVAGLHERDDADVGIGEMQKLGLGKPDDPVAKRFARAVAALRPGLVPRLYRGEMGESGRHLWSRPPASVFGRGFEEPLPSGALTFAISRHVAYYRRAHRVCTFLHEPETLEAMFEAAVATGLGFRPDSPQRQRMAELLRERLSEPELDSLRVVCARMGHGARVADLGTWRRATELSCARAGLLLSGDLDGAIWMLRWNRERRRLPTEDASDDLIAFWTSGAHVRLRHMLGLAIED